MSWAGQTRRNGSSSLRVKADKAGLVPALLTPSSECRSPRLIGESDVNRHIFDRANRHRTQRFLHRLYILLNRGRRARPAICVSRAPQPIRFAGGLMGSEMTYLILARIRGVTPALLALRSSELQLKSGINRAPYGLPPFIPF